MIKLLAMAILAIALSGCAAGMTTRGGTFIGVSPTPRVIYERPVYRRPWWRRWGHYRGRYHHGR
jgi:hypothetical protein